MLVGFPGGWGRKRKEAYKTLKLSTATRASLRARGRERSQRIMAGRTVR